MLETVTLTVDGRVLAHTRCTLSASAEQAVREASFALAWNGPGLPCRPDAPATVHVSGALWGTGFVRGVNPRVGPDSRDTEVSFVSRTIDATECSIDHPTGLAEDVDLAGIAKTFDMLGIGVEGAGGGAKKPVHKVRPGETLFETLETDARARGVLIHDTPSGRLRLADRPEGRHAGVLATGVNVIEASASLSGRTRHSSVKVRGQASVGTTAAVVHPEAEARDQAAPRRRPLILVHEGEASSERLKKRAAWELRRGAGAGTTASVTVPGWRDAGGRLWTRNYLVAVAIPEFELDQDMIVASASLEQDAEGGTTATLSLKDPRALGGDNPRGGSGAAWASPTGADARFSEG